MASHAIDLGNTLNYSQSGFPNASFGAAAGVGSTPASGTVIGQIIDLQHFDTLCNLWAAGGPSISGQFRIAIQTSEGTTSGSFTDPTSGMPNFPSRFISGGIAVFNSGNAEMNSGGIGFASFVRPHRYARGIVLSGDQFNAPVMYGFLTQARATGSGGGFSLSPGSGTVNV